MLAEVRACHIRGLIDTVSGQMTVTDRRLHFAPETFIVDMAPIDVSITEISAVTPKLRWSLYPNQVHVATLAGRVFRFGLPLWGGPRQRMLAALRKGMAGAPGST